MSGPAFAFPESVLAREVSGEMVLLDLQREEYYGLDRVGADMVIRLTQQPRDQAVAALCQVYEVAPDVLTADLERLVDQLLDAGLLVRTQTQ
ncbi:MAG TPA: PqqD family protein [Streptomyces sp.]|jgi:hypothetical protein|uniref:PqqD family protein n=1 Tax=Streptomyces sp. TaxID=1931 RepID=UPI002D108CDB|nr:PqqD family protein [Streptomyces sp.]HWU05305.1 PqqD family protein [Streptomyces sp.]